jgi:hypothetical protein
MNTSPEIHPPPCRHCGCTQQSACVLCVLPDDAFATCAWIEPALCSNPDCLRAELANLRMQINLQNAVQGRPVCGLCANPLPLLPGRRSRHVCDRCAAQIAECLPH